jgi:hypothetical protein
MASWSGAAMLLGIRHLGYGDQLVEIECTAASRWTSRGKSLAETWFVLMATVPSRPAPLDRVGGGRVDACQAVAIANRGGFEISDAERGVVAFAGDDHDRVGGIGVACARVLG